MNSARKLRIVGSAALLMISVIGQCSAEGRLSQLQNISKFESISLVIPLPTDSTFPDLGDGIKGPIILDVLAGYSRSNWARVEGAYVFRPDPAADQKFAEMARQAGHTWLYSMPKTRWDAMQREGVALQEMPPELQALACRTYFASGGTSIDAFLKGRMSARMHVTLEVTGPDGSVVQRSSDTLLTYPPQHPESSSPKPPVRPVGTGLTSGKLDFGFGKILTLRELTREIWREFGEVVVADFRLYDSSLFISGGYDLPALTKILDEFLSTKSPTMLNNASAPHRASLAYQRPDIFQAELEKRFGDSYRELLQGKRLKGSDVKGEPLVRKDGTSLNEPHYSVSAEFDVVLRFGVPTNDPSRTTYVGFSLVKT